MSRKLLSSFWMMLLTSAILVIAWVPARATTILVERGVLADSMARAPGEFLPTSEMDFSADLGSLDTVANAEAALSGVEGIARASQRSNVGATAIDFFGTTTIGGFAAGPERLGDYQAESSLYLMLEVDSPQTYSIEGLLSVASSATGDSFSSLEFWETGGDTLFSAEVSFEGSEEVSASGMLMPGVSYELLVLIRSAGSVNLDMPTVSGQAGANIVMLTTPEPGSATLLGVGLALLAGRPRRGFDRSPRSD